MYCIHNGKPCLMVYDTEKGKYVYNTEASKKRTHVVR